MKKTVKIFAYNQGSRSARALAEKLGVLRIRHLDSKFRAKEHHKIINWGSRRLPPNVVGAGTIINPTEFVSLCADKTETLQFCAEKEIPHVEFTTDDDEAYEWLQEGCVVVGRETTKGRGGEGILVFEHIEDFVSKLPLYTKYFPKKQEWRVHISSHSGPFYLQRKVLRRGVDPEEVDWKIRNLEGGFIFQRYNEDVPDRVVELSVLLYQKVKKVFPEDSWILNADILFNEKKNRAVVCEFNSAPGLDDMSASVYAEELKRILGFVTETKER